MEDSRNGYMVSSMIAETMSPSAALSALMALARETLACVITSSMSFASTPSASSAPASC